MICRELWRVTNFHHPRWSLGHDTRAHKDAAHPSLDYESNLLPWDRAFWARCRDRGQLWNCPDVQPIEPRDIVVSCRSERRESIARCCVASASPRSTNKGLSKRQKLENLIYTQFLPENFRQIMEKMLLTFKKVIQCSRIIYINWVFVK